MLLDFGLWSLTPPLVALTLALATRKVVFSLATGCIAGAIVFGIGTELEHQAEASSVLIGLLNGLIGFVKDGVIGQPANPGHAQILVLIFMIGGFVHLLEHQ